MPLTAESSVTTKVRAAEVGERGGERGGGGMWEAFKPLPLMVTPRGSCFHLDSGRTTGRGFHRHRRGNTLGAGGTGQETNSKRWFATSFLPSFRLEERAGKRGLERGQVTLMSQPLALSVLNYPSLFLQRCLQRPVLRTKWFIPDRFPIPQLLLSVGDSLSSPRSLALAGFR